MGMFFKNFRKPQLLVACFLFVFALSFPAYAEKLSLSGAVKIAIEKNPDLLAAKNQKDAASAKIPQVLALDNPRIGLEYEQIPSGSRNPEDGMKMYTAEQMIMFPGKIYAEWQMAKAESSMLEANYQAKVLEISAQVKSSYYELFYADRAIEAMAEIKDLLAGIKKFAEAKYVVGDTMQADVLLANIEYLMRDNELKTMKQEKEIKEIKLKALLNRNDAVTIETEAVLNLPGTIAPETALEQSALNNRPELLAMKAELEAKDAAHLNSKMEYFPDTMLGVKKRVMDGWDAMISFSVPLYFWKQSYGMSSAGLEREAAEAAYKNMKNMTGWMVKESWVMADSARRTARLYEEKIVPQSSQALKVALTAYKSGKVDFQTLLNIERAYREAKLKIYESQVNYGKALSELERISGKELMQ
ncbi:MAG: TolC family protein [Candidatus Margulisiibacteriota bacterium]